MIITKDRARAAKYYSPLILLMVFLLLFSFIFRTDVPLSYLSISLETYGYINLALFTYGLPLLLVVICLYAIHKGFLIYKYKLIPPTDIPTFHDEETTETKCSICIYLLSLLFLVFSLYMLYFGHNLFLDIYYIRNT